MVAFRERTLSCKNPELLLGTSLWFAHVGGLVMYESQTSLSYRRIDEVKL